MALDTTVVIQTVSPNGRGAVFIKGTVDGVAHKMRWDNRLFAPAELNAQKVAAEFLEHFLDRASVDSSLAEETVSLKIPGADTALASVVFAADSVVTPDSYDDYLIAGTVGGTSTIAVVNAKLFHQKYKALEWTAFKEWLASELYRQRVLNLQAAHLIDTFTL